MPTKAKHRAGSSKSRRLAKSGPPTSTTYLLRSDLLSAVVPLRNMGMPENVFLTPTFLALYGKKCLVECGDEKVIRIPFGANANQKTLLEASKKMGISLRSFFCFLFDPKCMALLNRGGFENAFRVECEGVEPQIITVNGYAAAEAKITVDIWAANIVDMHGGLFFPKVK